MSAEPAVCHLFVLAATLRKDSVEKMILAYRGALCSEDAVVGGWIQEIMGENVGWVLAGKVAVLEIERDVLQRVLDWTASS